ncbi:hypothetical protein AALO_G00029480 [Alosa alosa]|uniref:Uncharacterized protein n=1 Tax=Alosa alosa TaxID=278164 RepID=A0AAV6HDW1_9TELE|nr:hypothetical protein AALO_G00029480 [Alosa alosa]
MRNLTMYLAKALTMLTLCSWVAAGSTDCSNLVRYLKPEDANLVFGKWTVVIATADEALHGTVQQLRSSWFEVKPFPDSSVVHFHWRERIGGVCTYGAENATVYKDRTALAIESEQYKGQYLHTCPDCYLTIIKAEINGLSGRYFVFAKRGGSLTDSERQSFEMQAECLGFLPTYFTFPNTSELCPEQEQPVNTR